MDTETMPRPYLTPQEHRYLWLLSRGHTPVETQKIMGIGRNPTLGTRMREKLQAVTTPQALYHAALLDLVGPRLECGTIAGYRRHHGLHEPVCPACRREWGEFTERTGGLSALRRPHLTEPELRLLRALDAGRSVKQIASNWGISTRTLDGVRSSLYTKLDVAHRPDRVRRSAALEEGRRQGLLRPDTPQIPERPARRAPGDLTPLEVQTLVAVDGRSLSQAGLVLGGIPGSSVSSRLALIYRKLDVLSYAHGHRREAALKEARNRGYLL